MTTVVIGREESETPVMQFEFESEMAAYGFYADAKDSYREDDLYIEMIEEPYNSEPVNGWDYDECLDRRE